VTNVKGLYKIDIIDCDKKRGQQRGCWGRVFNSKLDRFATAKNNFAAMYAAIPKVEYSAQVMYYCPDCCNFFGFWLQ
jgi:hypothetical protein